MNIIDILIILGCLAVGYWIVNSVIGKGIDTRDASRKPEPPRREDERPALRLPAATPTASSPVKPRPRTGHDWFIVLDIPSDSSRKDIQAAMKRRLAQAEANGDAAGAEQIRRAAETGMKQAR
jgi:hypothetical protein